MVALAVVCTSLAYIIYFRILAKAGATNILLVTFLVPVSAILLGALVLGVPDDERGQVVAAVVLADPGDEPDLEQVRVDLRVRLSAYKVPRRFLVLAPDELPMLSSGKPDMHRIVEQFDGR